MKYLLICTNLGTAHKTVYDTEQDLPLNEPFYEILEYDTTDTEPYYGNFPAEIFVPILYKVFLQYLNERSYHYLYQICRSSIHFLHFIYRKTIGGIPLKTPVLHLYRRLARFIRMFSDINDNISTFNHGFDFPLVEFEISLGRSKQLYDYSLNMQMEEISIQKLPHLGTDYHIQHLGATVYDTAIIQGISRRGYIKATYYRSPVIFLAFDNYAFLINRATVQRQPMFRKIKEWFSAMYGPYVGVYIRTPYDTTWPYVEVE